MERAQASARNDPNWLSLYFRMEFLSAAPQRIGSGDNLGVANYAAEVPCRSQQKQPME
jgi:hypothetical protein